jgi:hypothetical protein
VIAIATLLHANKRLLLEKVMGEVWNLDCPGQSFAWVVADNDADEATKETLSAVAERVTPGAPVQFVNADLEGLRRVDRIDDPRYLSGNPDHLVKMGRLREAVRQEAVSLFPSNNLFNGMGSTVKVIPDYLFWLDTDVAPPEGGLAMMVDFLEATTGRYRPRAVSGVYPDRTTGRLIAQYWKGQPNPAQVFPGMVRPVGFNGLGCCLVEAEAARRIGWANWDLEPTKWAWGEDVVYFQNMELFYGVPLSLHGGVLCSHFQDNGFAWSPALTNKGRDLAYIPDRSHMFEERLIQIYWIGREGARVEVPIFRADREEPRAETYQLDMVLNTPIEVSPEAARWMTDSPYYSRKPLEVQQ